MTEKSTQAVRVRELAVPVDEASEPDEALRKIAASKLGVADSALSPVKIVRRALDARHRALRYVYTVEIELENDIAERLIRAGRAEAVRRVEQYRHVLPSIPDGPQPVVVGAGPAGLFAALTLVKSGWAPLIIERGRSVDERGRDVSNLYARGILDPESNVCFGEGGAGAYSDGKLYTRVNDPRVERVMEELVLMGANPDIRVDHRPHLGTDRLVALLRNMRAHLIERGAIFRFSTAVDKFVIESGKLEALVLRDGERIAVGPVVLSTGHSSREIWSRLLEAGLPLETRPFAVGFRVEHPQTLINRLRYGVVANKGILPAADYRLTFNEKGGSGRGVYSFCMCPGGVVVPTPTLQGELCVNGMSHASRAGKFANSALVVTVTPEDYHQAGYDGPLAGVDFQKAIERKAFAAGGGGFVAPAMRFADYFAGKASSDLPQSTYRRGLLPAKLDELYPEDVNTSLRRAIASFDSKMHGFLTDDAVLIGVETRTSSPVRVPRDDTMQATGATGLYPAGEGVGYGGGIVSSAVDGMRAAEAILESAGAVRHVLPT
ncbi:MAG: hypothetical protein A2289_20245 [Deltaproteobacteria bacterium RIFOXYA12_FULL_58_15]|nr:MAG: hypothetical protein A2289_20245 [Deltaproteobacteria bacterium RIFOXYA12_FULL_58_15]